MKKKRKKRRIIRTLKTMFMSFLMIFAALSGIYCARIYTTPYSSVVDEFSVGTLDGVKISKEKCNILIMGTDKEGLRTDVMMLAQIDPKNGTAVVMSIPRDTRVKYRGVNRKITEVHSVGMRNGKHGRHLRGAFGGIRARNGHSRTRDQYRGYRVRGKGLYRRQARGARRALAGERSRERNFERVRPYYTRR